VFGCLIFGATHSAAVADWLDGTLGDVIYRSCRANDGDSDGCACAAQYVRDSMSSDYLPIMETAARGQAQEAQRLAQGLGVFDRTWFQLQVGRIATVGTYQCEGARGFLLALILPFSF